MSTTEYKTVRLPANVAEKLEKINANTGTVRWKIIEDALDLYEKIYLVQRNLRVKQIINNGA